MYERSFHCLERYGMVNRRLIASKSAQEVYYENGTFKILIQIQRKNENLHQRRASLQRKWVIGSKIVDNETEQLLKRIGKLKSFYATTFYCSNCDTLESQLSISVTQRCRRQIARKKIINYFCIQLS